MTTKGFEAFLRKKAEEAPVPELRFPDIREEGTDWKPFALRPKKKSVRLSALIAVAAALAVVACASLAYATWRGGPEPAGPGSAVSSGMSTRPTPTGSTTAASATETVASYADPDLDKLAGYLQSEIPGIRPDQIDTFAVDRGEETAYVNLKGHFTRSDREQTVHFCRYFGEYFGESRANNLFIIMDDGDEIQTWPFAFSSQCIESLFMADLTGDGLEELIVSVDGGGNTEARDVYIFSAAGGKLRLLMNNGPRPDAVIHPDVPDTPPYFDLGFSGEPLSDYRILIRNRHTGFEKIVDVSSSDEMRKWFDADPRTDKYGIYFEDGDQVELAQYGGKTVLKYRSNVWVSHHMNTLGYSYAYVAYDSEKQQFTVIKAEFERHLNELLP